MERKNNTAVIFKNNYKEKETQPDFKGEGVVNGEEVRIAMWVNTSKKGDKYFAATFEKKEQQDGSGNVQKEQPKKAETKQEADDDLPF